MTGPVLHDDEPPRTEQEIARWAALVTARAEKFRALDRDVGAVTVTETSRDGVVRVTVDASGVLRQLELSDRIREFSGQTLAAHVLATLRRAQARIADEMSSLTADLAADDPAAAAAMVAGYRRRFPEQPPDPLAARGRLVHDDDREGPSVME
ncbi:YbaB/EbfC family nucleoid-associated protein [Lentzea sp. HUAS TT2]|uniref:YbaB/EbfC family nucleoid-associated protein n=1 Tax=Lentzea sp. HUAS TT2 TaxID=3447454 RepID=UPI003F71CE9E